MPTVQAKIDLEIRLQTHGHPPAGFVERDPAVWDAFPGFDVEAVVKPLVREVDGKALEVLALSEAPTPEELAAFKEDLSGKIHELFRATVKNSGPRAGERWSLLEPALFTGSQKPRWVGGVDAIAFELGTESINAMGQPTGKTSAHRQLWKDDGCFAKTWLCFRIVK